MIETISNTITGASARRLARTAEMVTHGHPDKYCDQVADSILDESLRQDHASRVAVECLAKNHLLVVSGEVTTEGFLDWEAIARHVYHDVIGYGAANHLTVIPCVCKQSDDIKIGVDRNGAGDQGIMVGFATDETPEALPLEYVLARKLAWGLKELRQQYPWFGPDGKTQVTLEMGAS